MKVVCVTHSSRPFVEARSSLNALASRFPPDRLRSLPPWESLAGIEEAAPFSGSLSLWRLDEGDAPSLLFLRAYQPDYKVQSAIFARDKLLVCGADRLEVLDASFNVLRTVRDNWICGGHTVFVDEAGYVWLTSAPANAILRVDIESGSVVERLKLPEKYGSGYVLEARHDLRKHFVPTDLQPTHVNCAYPIGSDVIVTMLIPGAVGIFDQDRAYREIASGFRGCHGGKLSPAGATLYLTDSPAGLVWFLDPQSGVIRSRLRVASTWLHDSHMISEELLATTLSDKNELWLIDVASGRKVVSVDCSPFGASVMFVTSCDVTEAWNESLEPHPPTTLPEVKLGTELLDALFDTSAWVASSFPDVEIAGRLEIMHPDCREQYLALNRPLWLDTGKYRFSAKMAVERGGLAVGLLDVGHNQWLVRLTFDSARSVANADLEIHCQSEVQVIVSANNASGAGPILARLEGVSLRGIDADDSARTPFRSQYLLGHNLIDAGATSWKIVPPARDRISTFPAFCGSAKPNENLMVGPVIKLEPGEYLLEARVECRRGQIALGLLNKPIGKWHDVYRFDAFTDRMRKTLMFSERTVLQPVIVAAVSGADTFVEAEVYEISLRRIGASD